MRLTSDPRGALDWTGRVCILGVAIALGLVLAVRPAVAGEQGGAELAKSKICLGCHQPASKLVGPAIVSVAERYESLDDPVAYLSVTIRQGGRGRWGAVPMPAQSQVSEDEARRLAQWILSLRK